MDLTDRRRLNSTFISSHPSIHVPGSSQYIGMAIKTLHITNAYHQTSGGIRAFYRALLEGANRRGRLMRLIVPGERSEIEEVGSYGRIYHIAARRAFLFDNRYRLLMPPTYLPPFRGELWRILRDEQPDLIEICDKYSVNWMAGLLRKGLISGLRRPPLVGMSCERMDDNVGGVSGAESRRPVLVAIPSGVLSTSHSSIITSPIRTIPRPNCRMRCGSATSAPFTFARWAWRLIRSRAARRSEISRRKLIAEAGGGEGTKLLLYAGRLSPEKNVSLLIEMIERLGSDFMLIVAGDGPLADWMENEAKIRAPGRVRLLGHISDRSKLLRSLRRLRRVHSSEPARTVRHRAA